MSISSKDLTETRERISRYVHVTPVMTSESLNRLAGCSLFFKCENFQKVGAFKARGAMNAILCLTEEERKAGVATHSSGNHAQALARAAKLVGAKAHIVMPRTAPAVKRNAVIDFGGIVYTCEPTQESRESTLADVIRNTGAIEIHPFNNERVIAGQATAFLELHEQVGSLDAVVAPVGGGGLLSGTCLAVKYFSPGTRVFAGEPSGADDAFRSMQSRKHEKSQANSIADGLLTSLGSITLPIILEHATAVITVSDEEIVEAMKLIFDKLKIVVEPSGAVPFAAILNRKDLFKGTKTGVILSGGNVDLSRLATLFKKN